MLTITWDMRMIFTCAHDLYRPTDEKFDMYFLLKQLISTFSVFQL